MADKDRTNRRSDDQLAVLIAAGQTVREAAATAAVSERTAYRRAADADFQDRVRRLRREMFDAATGKLADNLSRATETLIALLGPDVPPRVRLGAAKAIVESACNLRNLTDIEERLAALEAMQK